MTVQKRRYALYLTIIYSVFFAVLFAVELVVRIALPHVASIHYFVPNNINTTKNGGHNLFEGDPLMGWRLQADLEKVLWDYTMVEQTNHQHMRMPYDVPEKTPDTVRIMCLGDSVTFGYRVPVSFPNNPNNYNPRHLPFTRLMEEALRQKYPHKTIEVLTMAVPGYTTYQGYNWLKRDIRHLQPDLITICFGWNDTDYRPLPDREALPDGRAKVFLRGLVAKSQTAIYLSKALGNLRKKLQAAQPGKASVQRVAPDNYINNILGMIQLAQSQGARVIVLGQVYRDAVENPRQANAITSNRIRLKETCEKQGIPYLQFDQLIETGFPENKRLFGELIHPNAQGHRLMANEILTYMDKIKFMEQIGN